MGKLFISHSDSGFTVPASDSVSSMDNSFESMRLSINEKNASPLKKVDYKSYVEHFVGVIKIALFQVF